MRAAHRIISTGSALTLTITLIATLVIGTFSWAYEPTPIQQAATLEFPYVPDSTMTTGSVCTPQDRDFQGYRYPQQIAYCARNVDSQMKGSIYLAYGVPKKCRGEYTVDHFIPLSFGGTNHRENLWPEHKSVKRLRQNLELELFEAVRDGRLSQADAIAQIREAKLNPPVTNPNPSSICH